MSRITFTNYGALAALDVSPTRASGRYDFQADEARTIFEDVVAKLRLSPEDRLLEIGCGSGDVLIPLVPLVAKATGLDHANCIALLRKRCRDDRLETIEGNFLDLQVSATFDKILIYSVLHALSDEAEVVQFVEKALHLLSAGGACLLGDIPNVDRKRRFTATARGKALVNEWEKRVSSTPTEDVVTRSLVSDSSLITFTDEVVARLFLHFRRLGYEVDILSQREGLPFCHTREDILIRKLRN